MKEIYVRFGRYVWGSSHVSRFCRLVQRLQRLWQLKNVTAGLLVQLIVDSQLLNLPQISSHVLFVFDQNHACNMMANFWSSPITVSLKEARERRVLVCLVGSIVLMYMSQSVHALSSLSTVGLQFCQLPHPTFLLHKWYFSWLTVISSSNQIQI